MKELILVTGPIAVGKTTFIKSLYSQYNDYLLRYELVNTDLYYYRYFKTLYDSEQNNYKKSKIYANYKLQKIIDNGDNFVWETVVAKDNKIDILKEIKEKGYHIISIVLLPKDFSYLEKRSNRRVNEEWYSVPGNKIDDRYKKLLRNIPIIESLSDQFVKIYT